MAEGVDTVQQRSLALVVAAAVWLGLLSLVAALGALDARGPSVFNFASYLMEPVCPALSSTLTEPSADTPYPDLIGPNWFIYRNCMPAGVLWFLAVTLGGAAFGLLFGGGVGRRVGMVVSALLAAWGIVIIASRLFSDDPAVVHATDSVYVSVTVVPLVLLLAWATRHTEHLRSRWRRVVVTSSSGTRVAVDGYQGAGVEPGSQRAAVADGSRLRDGGEPGAPLSGLFARMLGRCSLAFAMLTVGFYGFAVGVLVGFGPLVEPFLAIGGVAALSAMTAAVVVSVRAVGGGQPGYTVARPLALGVPAIGLCCAGYALTRLELFYGTLAIVLQVVVPLVAGAVAAGGAAFWIAGWAGRALTTVGYLTWILCALIAGPYCLAIGLYQGSLQVVAFSNAALVVESAGLGTIAGGAAFIAGFISLVGTRARPWPGRRASLAGVITGALPLLLALNLLTGAFTT